LGQILKSFYENTPPTSQLEAGGVLAFDSEIKISYFDLIFRVLGIVQTQPPMATSRVGTNLIAKIAVVIF